jgi:glycosyltransferase involved in cell wall biosynthesis
MRPVILEVVQRLAPGGIEVLVLELERVLSATADVQVVSLEGTRQSLAGRWPRAAALGVRLHALDKKPGRDLATLVRLFRLVRRLAPLAVHTHHIGPLLYGGLAARLARVPRLVHTEHDAWHLAHPRQRSLLSGALHLLRPHLVADAVAVADEVVAAVPSSRPHVIANGIDTSLFSPGDRAAARLAAGLPPDARVVGTAGRLEAAKGHDLLLAAFARLPADVVLAVAGDGSRRTELAAAAGRAGLGDRVRFLGHVADMPSFYRALDVFCLASSAEGLPLALLEAQACGVPAVVTDVGGMREVLAAGASVAVPPADERGLAAALFNLLERRPETDPRPFIVARHDLSAAAASYRMLLVS